MILQNNKSTECILFFSLYMTTVFKVNLCTVTKKIKIVVVDSSKLSIAAHMNDASFS